MFLKKKIVKSLLLQMLLAVPFAVFGANDSLKNPGTTTESIGHQLRFNFDISRPIFNSIRSSGKSYEFGVDYYLKKEVYIVAEGGFGNSEYNYPDLSYSSNNTFFRAGLDKSLLKRRSKADWDIALIGFRYGIGFINRGEAKYEVVDSVWGLVSGKIPSTTTTGHWAEVVGGIKVELLKNIMAGWNVRARFLLNPRDFRELAPVLIAGYGKGDKTSVFDFNFYLSYAIRWKKTEHRVEGNKAN